MPKVSSQRAGITNYRVPQCTSKAADRRKTCRHRHPGGPGCQVLPMLRQPSASRRIGTFLCHRMMSLPSALRQTVLHRPLPPLARWRLTESLLPRPPAEQPPSAPFRFLPRSQTEGTLRIQLQFRQEPHVSVDYQPLSGKIPQAPTSAHPGSPKSATQGPTPRKTQTRSSRFPKT